MPKNITLERSATSKEKMLWEKAESVRAANAFNAMLRRNPALQAIGFTPGPDEADPIALAKALEIPARPTKPQKPRTKAGKPGQEIDITALFIQRLTDAEIAKKLHIDIKKVRAKRNYRRISGRDAIVPTDEEVRNEREKNGNRRLTHEKQSESRKRIKMGG